MEYGFCAHKWIISRATAIRAAFFTTLNPTTVILASFATFGVGFAARPIAAFLSGVLGNSWGRRPTLILAVVLVGAGTGVVDLFATYASIGLAAPIILSVPRLPQGLAVSGE